MELGDIRWRIGSQIIPLPTPTKAYLYSQFEGEGEVFETQVLAILTEISSAEFIADYGARTITPRSGRSYTEYTRPSNWYRVVEALGLGESVDLLSVAFLCWTAGMDGGGEGPAHWESAIYGTREEAQDSLSHKIESWKREAATKGTSAANSGHEGHDASHKDSITDG